MLKSIGCGSESLSKSRWRIVIFDMKVFVSGGVGSSVGTVKIVYVYVRGEVAGVTAIVVHTESRTTDRYRGICDVARTVGRW